MTPENQVSPRIHTTYYNYNLFPTHEIEPGCQRRRRGHSVPGRRRQRDPGHI